MLLAGSSTPRLHNRLTGGPIHRRCNPRLEATRFVFGDDVRFGRFIKGFVELRQERFGFGGLAGRDGFAHGFHRFAKGAPTPVVLDFAAEALPQRFFSGCGDGHN